MVYTIFRGIFRIIFKIFFRWEIYGLENIPKDGPVILCSNHISNWDPPLVGSPLSRKVYFMAKEELFRNSILKFFLTQFGAFPIKRGEADRKALVTTLKILKEGNVLGIFPEGTRSKDGKLQEAHSGAGIFALRTGAPVIPIAIVGPYRLFRPIKIVYGKPLYFNAEGKGDSADAKEVTNAIMAEIAHLLNAPL